MVLGIPKMMQKTEIIKVQRRNWIELLESESQLIDYGKVGRGGMIGKALWQLANKAGRIEVYKLGRLFNVGQREN